MKNTFGQNLSVTIFGESHGPAVGAVIDGITPGIEVNYDIMSSYLTKRRPVSSIDTPRREKDEFQILSGVFNGKTTGTPICIVIPNENTKSSDYEYGMARPSHADYAGHCKYHGFEDYRGGGHFSGRITAALVAAGGILLPALEKKGIIIGTHIIKCAEEKERCFENVKDDIEMLKKKSFPTLDDNFEKAITERIMNAAADKNSVGGVTQTAIYGMPAGVGEPWFDSVEGMLAHILYSLGGVKGVEFGRGFKFGESTGADVNDEYRLEDGNVITATNNNGGINGGITNGMPILFNCAVKPTPSIARKQNTVDFVNGKECEIEIHGRHDPAIIRRICPVIDSVTAIAVCDLLIGRYGTDWLNV